MSGSITPDRPTGPRTTGRNRAGGAARKRHGVQGGTGEANRTAVAILEVLAGARSPAEAAEALGVSLPRYYILETRALEGMVAACEPKPLGKQPSPETRIAALEKQLGQAERECARQQALVRVAQRSVGLRGAAPPPAESGKGKPGSKRDGKGRKKRRPTVRALKAAETLRTRLASPEGSGVQHTSAGDEATAPAGRASPIPAAPAVEVGRQTHPEAG